MKKINVIILVLFVAALLVGTAYSQTQKDKTEQDTTPGPGGMGMHHEMMEHGKTSCGCEGCRMGMEQCMCGCGMHGMGKGMMGHGGMGRGGMMPGLMGIMGVHPGMGEMRALMNPRVKEHLANPEIKAFLDETKDQRRNLLLRKFDYFEAARNPQTKPEDLKKLRQEIKKLQADIYVKSPDIMDTSDKDTE